MLAVLINDRFDTAVHTVFSLSYILTTIPDYNLTYLRCQKWALPTEEKHNGTHKCKHLPEGQAITSTNW